MPKVDQCYIDDWGIFRPGGWEALLAKKEEGAGNLDLPSPLRLRGWVKGLHLFLLQASRAPLPPKAEKGQEWPPGWMSFQALSRTLSHHSQDQTPSLEPDNLQLL